MDIYADAAELFARELGPDETLLWAGRPRQGIFLRPSDFYLVPFSLLWAGFAVFWETSVILVGAPWFFALWGVPFILVGIYITVGRFWVDALLRSRMFYAVTTQQVVIISGSFARSTRSLSLESLTDVSLAERPGGGGTITFGSGIAHGRYPTLNGFHRGYNSPPQFELAADVRHVYEIIRAARRDAVARACLNSRTDEANPQHS